MQSLRLLLLAAAASAPLASLAATANVQAIAAAVPQAVSQGDLYGLDFEARLTSHRDRDTVRAEAILAAPHFKDYSVSPATGTVSVVSRESVRAEAAAAQHASRIAIGNLG